MKRLRWSLAFFLALAATPALALNGIRVYGFGAVQDAMGGAAIGAPLDAATVITNPAGLTFTGSRVDVGAGLLDADVSYRAQGAIPAYGSGAEQTSDRKATPVPAIGLVLPSTGALTVGAGLYGVSGLGLDYPQDLLGGTMYTSYAQLRGAVGGAYRLLPELSVGVTLNLMYATLEYAVAGGTGMPPRTMSTSYGWGATVGAMYRPVEWLTLGAAYETRSRFADFAFNVPAHTLLTAAGPVSVPGGVEKMRFDQPPVATVGASVIPLEGLVVAADVQLIQWSETLGKNQPAVTSNPAVTGNSGFDCDWSDQVVYKVGAEYAALPWLALRAGWNYGKNPLRADRALENVAFGANAEHHLTGGFGVRVGRATINLAGWWAPAVSVSGANASQYVASYRTRVEERGLDVALSVPL